MTPSYREAVLLSLRYVALTKPTVSVEAVAEYMVSNDIPPSRDYIEEIMRHEGVDRGWVEQDGPYWLSLICPGEIPF